MFEQVPKTWAIMNCCIRVLKKDKELMIFPVISAVTILVVAVLLWFFFNALGLLMLYFAATFVIVFFNTALVSCALERLQGGDPTVSSGLREAAKRLHLILGWSLLSATVGLLLYILESCFEFLGHVISAIFGTIWGLVTFFAIPVLVAQDLGPIETLKESGRLFRERWGEHIIGNFSFGVMGLLFSLPFFALAIFGVFFDGKMMYIILGVAITGIITISLIQGVLASLFQAALYLYARDGFVGDGFFEDDLQLAVRTFE